MTVFEYLELAHNGWSTAMATASLGIAVLSGYAVIAYLVGAKLSTKQIVALNIGYITWGGFLVYTTYTFILGAYENLGKAAVLDPEEIGEIVNPHAPLFVLGLGTYLGLASLWFMWDVRHPKD
jgi:hypothetical protein